MALTIKQIKDTGVQIRVRHAFAEVEFRFRSVDGGIVTVALDMESALQVIECMDDRDSAVLPGVKPWWKFW